jgi:hypothetical protein
MKISKSALFYVLSPLYLAFGVFLIVAMFLSVVLDGALSALEVLNHWIINKIIFVADSVRGTIKWFGEN